MIDPVELFGFLAASVGVLIAIGWLRRLVGMMGPE